jgi:hypothetical protein
VTCDRELSHVLGKFDDLERSNQRDYGAWVLEGDDQANGVGLGLWTAEESDFGAHDGVPFEMGARIPKEPVGA